MAGNSIDSLRDIQERMARLKKQGAPVRGSSNVQEQREQVATALTEIHKALPSIIRDLRSGTNIDETRTAIEEFGYAAAEVQKCASVLR